MSEKTRTVWGGIFGVALGMIQLIIATSIISFYIYYNMMVDELTSPTYYYEGPPGWVGGLFGSIGWMILIGGIYVLINAIKRIIDHGLAAYIASKEQEKVSLPPPSTTKS